MAKQFQFSDDARHELILGMDTVVRAVGATLGPTGRHVLLGQEVRRSPRVQRRGHHRQGHRAERALPEHGRPAPQGGGQQDQRRGRRRHHNVDGLGGAMIQEGFKNVTAGANPMVLKRGHRQSGRRHSPGDRGDGAVGQGKDQIIQVAPLGSARRRDGSQDRRGAWDKVGRQGIVTVEESQGLYYEVDYVEGMEIDRGYVSPHFVTDQDRMVAEIDNPYVLLTSEKISSMSGPSPAPGEAEPREQETSSLSARTSRGRRWRPWS